MAAYTDVKPLITDTMTESISQLLLRTKAASVTTGPETPCTPDQPALAQVGRPEPSGQPERLSRPWAWMGEGVSDNPPGRQVTVPKPCCDLVAPRCPQKPWGPPELELEMPVFKSLLGQRLLWAQDVTRRPHAGRTAWTLQPTSHRGFKEAAWARCPPPPGRDPFPPPSLPPCPCQGPLLPAAGPHG